MLAKKPTDDLSLFLLDYLVGAVDELAACAVGSDCVA
jgi:hypothetical protein